MPVGRHDDGIEAAMCYRENGLDHVASLGFQRDLIAAGFEPFTDFMEILLAGIGIVRIAPIMAAFCRACSALVHSRSGNLRAGTTLIHTTGHEVTP